MTRNIPQRQQHQQQQVIMDEGAALAAEIFDHFCSASTMRQVLGLYRKMCDTISLRPEPLNEFYPKLKAKIKNWKAQALWKKFDARASHRVYNKGTACAGTRVLVIGAGPCGLRTAIEAQLLGAKVVVVEKRDRMSRNNVLHLWPFVITDLKALGAKKFYGKFCAGSIDHISIRQLQCMLMKVALLLGVEIHEGVSFVKTIEPTDGCGWRAHVTPDDHAVSHYEFDVLIGADGKRNTLEGFKRKEFRGKLAIAITANFINRKSEAEARVEEISGVAFIFNQSFFKELYQTTGIDLENIVYYKDDTHYFVMTAKKHSLIDKGVIVQDFADPAELLASHNVNTDKLLDYAREAAEFSTKYQMPNLEFAVNHYGKPDVAMFDFTSMFQADNSCRVTVKKNYRLLSCLVGDSLLEPFWPTGSGCARGFLSSMDAAYACKLFANPRNSILGVLAQRESIYRLLAQTTPENLHRDIGAYTLDPVTRYPNLNKTTVLVHQVKHLLVSDDQSLYEQIHLDTNALQALPAEPMGKRKRRTADTAPLGTVLLRWIKSHLKGLDFVNHLTEASQCFTDGRVLCALINRYRPDLVDLNIIQELTPEECNERAFTILEHELAIGPVMSPGASISLEGVDSKVWLTYLEQICEVFRGEIPHVKHPKLDFDELKQRTTQTADVLMATGFSRLHKLAAKKAAENLTASGPGGSGLRKMSIEDDLLARRPRKSNLENRALSPDQSHDAPRRGKKRRSHDKTGNLEERMIRLSEIEANRQDRQNRRRAQRAQQTENFFKSLHMLQANTFLRESDSSSPFEDYSIYMYRQNAPLFNDRVKEMEYKLKYPDRERGILSAMPRGLDGQFSDRIKSMEQQIKSNKSAVQEKKPKDLLRAIGKIESNDWNVKQIERKMELSKKTTDIGKSREKVPKWNREQFLARQHKMSKADRQESVDEKYKDIDNTLKSIDKQLKEGHTLEVGERGKNKVASIAGQFKKKDDSSEEKSTGSKNAAAPKTAMMMSTAGVSEVCHFCKQRVYLMEKLSAEGLVCHRSCLKCHHCHTNLRMGGYAFDRDNPAGLFYCTQHFRLPPKEVKLPTKRHLPRLSATGKPVADVVKKTQEQVVPEKHSITTLDLLDRGQTPERIEFENADAMSDGEPSLENIIDENEWTDRNFGTGSEESDLSSDSDSDSDSDIYDDPIGSPLGAAQTLQLASDWIDKRYPTMQDSDDDFYEYSSEDDDADSQTEGEEFAKAREIRRQEVKLMPPPILPTDTETEAQSDSETTSPELNSATEISTDSEFDHDPIMRTPPKIFIDDSHLKKPTRVQIKQGVIDNGLHHRPLPPQAINRHAYAYDNNIHLEFKPLVEIDSTIILSTNRQPLKNPRPGNYDLTKTASTEGIASKKSLELKKRYLLGEAGNGTGILKSGSASALDTRFKSFHSNISECQKLLNNHPTLEQPLSPKLPPLIIGGQLTASTTSGTTKELEAKHHSDEKENVYNGNNNNNSVVAKKNSLNEIIDVQNMKKSLDYLDTVNTALVENKLKEILTSTDASASQKPIKTIDLVTPEKEKEEVKPMKIIDLTKVDLPESMLSMNKEFIKNMEISETPPPTPNTPLNFDIKSRFRTNFIDLTVDSPITDRSLVETRVNFAMTATNEQLNNKTAPPDILSNINLKNLENQQRCQEVSGLDVRVADEEERSRSPAQDTSIVVPTLIPRQKEEEEEHLSDSLSSSTTSSIGDIPHFILDSTTSPETQNGTTSLMCVAPTIEFHDHNGELMQMDSLQLIDDSADQEEKTLTPTPVEVPIPLDKATKNEINESSSSNKVPPTSQPTRPRYECNYQKHELKFDTKNQQKGETMKHLPFVQEPEPKPPAKLEKPKVLNLPKTNQPLIAQPELATPVEHKDDDKTPMNQVAPEIVSDSETEFTGQVLTETELSDWTADDAVSENFVDIEFVLNSNKGTIKRNKKSKKKTTMNGGSKHKLQPPSQGCGILKNLDIDEIEFMDTGSENESVAMGGGAVQASNTPVLKNHGYVEFVETNGFSRMAPPPRNLAVQTTYVDQVVEAVNKEVAGVDYIEQGNCILEGSNDDPSLKTPMNEPVIRLPFKFDLQTTTTHKFPVTVGGLQADSLNDIEDDSLMISGTMTTTEESDALTVVTSPLDSLPPAKGTLKTSSTTNSSTTTTTTPTDNNQSKTLSSSPRKPSGSSATTTSANSAEKEARRSIDKRKDSLKNIEDIGYEEYVKRLQQKIAQISNSPRNPEVVDPAKKTRRKLSKGDLLANESQAPTTPQNGESNRSMSFYEDAKLAAPPNLNKKLEEITKERVKQKDIIHDLVMDKLQTKKLLNAEKRMNRMKNRNLFNTSGGSTAAPEPKTSYTPPLPPPKTVDTPPSPMHKILRSNTTLATPVIAGRTYKERPLSDNLEKMLPPTPNLSKTQSFSVYSNMMSHKDMTPRYNPLPPAARTAMNTPGLAGSALTMTEKLREEARARAKLLSNRDLGISPEEKLQQLRKKYQQQMSQELYGDHRSPMPPQRSYVPSTVSPSLDDMQYREKKMMSSKSVNDIVKAAASMSSASSANIGSNDALNLNAIRNVQRNPDFTSDPNLSSGVETVQLRRKNQTPSTPERRKSIIRTVSDFFTIRKRDHSKEGGASGSKENGNVSGGKHESMFGMFSRISPKSKEKSKDKENSPMYEKSQSVTCLKQKQKLSPTQHQQTIQSDSSSPLSNKPVVSDDEEVPPVPPLPLNYQRSDDESCPASESKNELKKLRAITKASKQAELKRLRIAQEIQREQEEIEVQIKELEERGVAIEKALRGEGQNLEHAFDEGLEPIGVQDSNLLKELIEILRTIGQFKKRDEELGIRQQELQLEHRHAQLKEELNLRLSCNKLDKSSSDVAAEGAILNEMLEIVSKRAALRPSTENLYSDI